MRKPKDESLSPEQLLLQDNPVPVVITNSAGTILFRNDAAVGQLEFKRSESILPYLRRESAPLFEQLRLRGGAQVLSFRTGSEYYTACAFSYEEAPKLRRVLLQFISQRQLLQNSTAQLVNAVENDLSQNLTVIQSATQTLGGIVTDAAARDALAVMTRNCAGAQYAQRAIALYNRLQSDEQPHESAVNLQLILRVITQEMNRYIDPTEERPFDLRVIRPGKESDYLAVLDSCDLVNLMMPVLYWSFLCADHRQVFLTLSNQEEQCVIEVEYSGEPPIPSHLELCHPRTQARGEHNHLALRFSLGVRLCRARGWGFSVASEQEQTRIVITVPQNRAALLRCRSGQSAQEAAIDAARHMAGVDARCFFLGT